MNRLECLSQFSNAVLTPEQNSDKSSMANTRKSGGVRIKVSADISEEDILFRKMWCRDQIKNIGEFGAVL